MTAEFNRNVLRVINARLDADFDPEAFEHVAFFDEANSWIEMRLRANGAQRVRIDGRRPRGRPSPTARRSAPRSARSSRATPWSASCTARGLALDDFFTDGAGLFGLAFASPR